ncbi:pyrroline-5-carboxylate reductase [Flavobacteriaceae bacterium]|nr:pyrroline-5-carboxylate reductase [Flavobacteriaceae bacterium]
MKISIIGTGNLGLALAKGIVEHVDFEHLYLTKRQPSNLKNWSELPEVTVSSDNAFACSKSDVIILAIQPGQVQGVLKEVKEHVKGALIISVVTGKSLASLEEQLHEGQKIIRAMPNTAVAVAQSMTCICANKHSSEDLIIAEKLFQAVGQTLVIEEELMQAATVIGASGVAFWMRLIRATTQGAIQLGFEAEAAQKLAVQTCLGSASLLSEKESHPETEIDRVTTPKGCTISGLNEMEHQGLSSALIQGIVTSYNKINEIKN